MPESLTNLFYLCSRYVHIVAVTVIVGGTLFFELVVPLAIGELKNEVQLALFGRMRWIFRWVVYTSAIALVLTGTLSIFRNRDVLDGRFIQVVQKSAGAEKVQAMQDDSIFNRPRIWFIAHLIAGALALVVALSLVSGGRPPDRPLQWMRLNLLMLLIAMFLASASRGARQNLFHAVLQTPSVPTSHD